MKRRLLALALALSMILSAFATEEPPNFITIISAIITKLKAIHNKKKVFTGERCDDL